MMSEQELSEIDTTLFPIGGYWSCLGYAQVKPVAEVEYVILQHYPGCLG